MSFEQFQSAVKSMAKRAGCNMASVRFRHEDGKHTAYLPDDIRITGNTLSKRLAVRWGDRHFAYV